MTPTPMDIARDFDRMAITKDDILMVMNALLRRWRRNKRKNIRFILALEGLRVGVLATPAKVVNRVWPNLMLVMVKVLELNGARLAAGQNPNMKVILDKVIREIETGDFVGDPGDGGDAPQEGPMPWPEGEREAKK